jgi:hypothetical protein
VIVDTPINLLAGHDYILTAEHCASPGSPDVALKGPGGDIVVTVSGICDTRGVEFRAQYTATYFIEYDDAGTTAEVAPDCRADLTTLCHLAVNHTKDGDFNWPRDVDAFKVTLNRAYTYVFTLTGFAAGGDNGKLLRVLDKSGVVLKSVYGPYDPVTTLTFRPSKTDTYYFQGFGAADDEFYRYTLTLRIK